MATHQIRDVGHRPVGDPTRVHPGEVGHIGGQVEREAVHRNAARNADTNRRHLACAGPDSCETRLAPGLHAEVEECRDQHLFQITDERHDPHRVIQGDQRITDELAGTVIGDVSTPVHVMQFSAELGEHPRVDEKVGTIPVAADGVGVGMFEE